MGGWEALKWGWEGWAGGRTGAGHRGSKEWAVGGGLRAVNVPGYGVAVGGAATRPDGMGRQQGKGEGDGGWPLGACGRKRVGSVLPHLGNLGEKRVETGWAASREGRMPETVQTKHKAGKAGTGANVGLGNHLIQSPNILAKQPPQAPTQTL